MADTFEQGLQLGNALGGAFRNIQARRRLARGDVAGATAADPELVARRNAVAAQIEKNQDDNAERDALQQERAAKLRDTATANFLRRFSALYPETDPSGAPVDINQRYLQAREFMAQSLTPEQQAALFDNEAGADTVARRLAQPGGASTLLNATGPIEQKVAGNSVFTLRPDGTVDIQQAPQTALQDARTQFTQAQTEFIPEDTQSRIALRLAQAEAARREAATDSPVEGLSEGEKKRDRAFGDTLDAEQSAEKAALSDIAALDTIVAALRSNPSLSGLRAGALVSAADSGVPGVSNVAKVSGSDAVALRNAARGVIIKGLRNILGAQFTAKENEAFVSNVYDPGLPAANNAAALERFRDIVREQITLTRAKRAYFQQNGTLRGYVDPAPLSGEQLKVLLSAPSAPAAPAQSGPPPADASGVRDYTTLKRTPK